MIYLTSNPDKMREAKEFFEKKYGLEVEILNPDFEPVEIQASTCAEVVAYTVKDAAAIMGTKETKVRSELTAAKRMLRRKRDE